MEEPGRKSPTNRLENDVEDDKNEDLDVILSKRSCFSGQELYDANYSVNEDSKSHDNEVYQDDKEIIVTLKLKKRLYIDEDELLPWQMHKDFSNGIKNHPTNPMSYSEYLMILAKRYNSRVVALNNHAKKSKQIDKKKLTPGKGAFNWKNKRFLMRKMHRPFTTS